MTTGHGLETTYSNTLARKQMISDRIILADPYDITTIVALGLNNESKFAFVNSPGRTYTWLEDQYPAISSATAEADLASDTTEVTITVGNGDLFHVGDVVQIDDELMQVTSTSGVELTVTRDFGTTTAATHATISTMYLRYSARIEGTDSNESPWTEVTTGFNYSTIFHKEIYITRDDKLFPIYGIPSLKEYRKDKAMDGLMEQLCRMAYYGTLAVGSSSLGRSSAGLDAYITTNDTHLSSATLLRSHIDHEFQTIFAAGGKTDLILCDAWFQRKCNDFYEGFVSTERSESIGGMMIKQLMHPITGQLTKIVVDRNCPSGRAYFLDSRYVGYITIDPFFYEELAKTGDSEKGEIIGEYGFVCAYDKAHSALKAYSTTA
jgi:hypothetical protein